MKTRKNTSKQPLTPVFEKAGYTRVGEKQGGANSAGGGGLYKARDRLRLVKREPDMAKVIAEVVTGQLFALLMGQMPTIINPEKQVAEVNWVRSQNNKDVFVESVYLDKYQDDLWKVAYGKQAKKYKVRPSVARPLFFKQHERKIIANYLINNSKLKYDFVHLTVARLLLGDLGVHAGNYGLVKINNENRLAALDFGAGCLNLISNFNPFSWLQTGLPIYSVYKNHLLEYGDIPYSYLMGQALLRVSSINLSSESNFVKGNIQAIFHDDEAKFEPEDLKAFCARLGMHAADYNMDDKEDLIEGIANFMQERLQARQASLNEIGSRLFENGLRRDLKLINHPNTEKDIGKQILRARGSAEYRKTVPDLIEKVKDIQQRLGLYQLSKSPNAQLKVEAEQASLYLEDKLQELEEIAASKQTEILVENAEYVQPNQVSAVLKKYFDHQAPKRVGNLAVSLIERKGDDVLVNYHTFAAKPEVIAVSVQQEKDQTYTNDFFLNQECMAYFKSLSRERSGLGHWFVTIPNVEILDWARKQWSLFLRDPRTQGPAIRLNTNHMPSDCLTALLLWAEYKGYAVANRAMYSSIKIDKDQVAFMLEKLKKFDKNKIASYEQQHKAETSGPGR